MKNSYDNYVSSFLDYLIYELNYSLKTKKTYEAALKEYYQFLLANHYDFLNMDTDKAQKYKAHLIASHYENKTSSLHLSAVRSFYNYLIEIKAITSSAFLNMKNPKVSKKLPNFLNNSEVNSFFLEDNFLSAIDIRNAFIIEFLYVTGLRVSELCNIKINDLNSSNGSLKVMGKGSKERIVFYKACDSNLMNNYIDYARNDILNGVSSEYLFISKSGKPLSARMIENIVKEYARKKNIKSKVTPHTLRHTYATDLLNNGADIRSVGELLGHASLSTTQIYTHVTAEHLKKVYNKSHPRGKMQK